RARTCRAVAPHHRRTPPSALRGEVAKLGRRPSGARRGCRQALAWKSNTLPPIPLTRLGLRPIHPLPEGERNKGERRTNSSPPRGEGGPKGRMRGFEPSRRANLSGGEI